MDRAQATGILVEQLVEAGHINIETEATLDFYTKDAYSALPIRFQTKSSATKLFEDGGIHDINTHSVGLSKNVKANYMFCKRNFSVTGERYRNVKCILQEYTPFAIIGETEKKLLSNSFYKNPPKDIKLAMESLEIDDYLKSYQAYLDYETYLEQKEPGLNPDEYQNKIDLFKTYRGIFEAIKTTDDHGTKFKIFTQDRSYNKAMKKEIKAMGFNETSILAAKSIGPETTKDAKRLENYIFKEEAKMNLHMKEHHIDFIFNLPMDDRELKYDNKLILHNQNFSFRPIKHHLMNMYSQEPEAFKTGFEALTKENQRIILSNISSLLKTEQNPSMNAWLSNYGFSDMKLIDHIELYKTDIGRFKSMFKDTIENDPEQAELILKDLFDPEKITDSDLDEDISDWIFSEYKELAEKVGVRSVGE